MIIEDKEDISAQIHDFIEDLFGDLKEFDESNIIFDLDDFRERLELENLMTVELKEFIHNYMKFRNKR